MIKFNTLILTFCISLGLTHQPDIKPISSSHYMYGIGGIAMATCILGTGLYYWYQKSNRNIAYGTLITDDELSEIDKELANLEQDCAKLEKELGLNLSSESNQKKEDDEDLFYIDHTHSRLRQWISWQWHLFRHPRNKS